MPEFTKYCYFELFWFVKNEQILLVGINFLKENKLIDIVRIHKLLVSYIVFACFVATGGRFFAVQLNTVDDSELLEPARTHKQWELYKMFGLFDVTIFCR